MSVEDELGALEGGGPAVTCGFTVEILHSEATGLHEEARTPNPGADAASGAGLASSVSREQPAWL